MKLPFLVTEYDALFSLALCRVRNEDCMTWVFPNSLIEDVIRVLGRVVEFSNDQFVSVVPYCPIFSKVLEDPARKKGRGLFWIVSQSPKLFVIETVVDKKLVRKEVPAVAVVTLWKVILKQGLNVCVKSSTVAKNLIEALRGQYHGFERYHRESGSFDFAKFFGNRKDYFRYFYYPLKILQGEGLIEHHTAGMVERLSDRWHLQESLVEWDDTI